MMTFFFRINDADIIPITDHVWSLPDFMLDVTPAKYLAHVFV